MDDDGERQSTGHQCSRVFTLKHTFIYVYWWTQQSIHNTLIVLDRYLRLGVVSSGIVLSPFVAGIDLPHQGVVDSYNL